MRPATTPTKVSSDISIWQEKSKLSRYVPRTWLNEDDLFTYGITTKRNIGTTLFNTLSNTYRMSKIHWIPLNHVGLISKMIGLT